MNFTMSDIRYDKLIYEKQWKECIVVIFLFFTWHIYCMLYYRTKTVIFYPRLRRSVMVVSIRCLSAYIITATVLLTNGGCTGTEDTSPVQRTGGEMNAIFLHHSTGQNIWNGGVSAWIDRYNGENGTDYRIIEKIFPKNEPYGWSNYPFDYWNIWVKHAGDKPYVRTDNPKRLLRGVAKKILRGVSMGEPTLEMLTRDYNLIVWKHCFPVSGIQEDTGTPDISSPYKSLENYRAQYLALRDRMHEFPDTRFLVWTAAALPEQATTEDEARRAREFVAWVRDEWDLKGDNIFLFDFYALETEGDLYMRDDYAVAPRDPHPNPEFSQRAASLFAQRIVDVLEDRGDESPLTGS